MNQVLDQAAMGYALSVIAAVAAAAIALGLLTDPLETAGQRMRRWFMRHELAGTLMPGMLGRLGTTLAEHCEDRTPAQLRTELERCRRCPEQARCRAEQASARSGAPDFSFCANRRG